MGMELLSKKHHKNEPAAFCSASFFLRSASSASWRLRSSSAICASSYRNKKTDDKTKELDGAIKKWLAIDWPKNDEVHVQVERMIESANQNATRDLHF